MPTRPAVPNVLKHQCMYDLNGEVAVMTLWSKHDNEPTQENVDLDRATIKAWHTFQWKLVANSAASLRSIKSWNFAQSPPVKFDDDVLYPSSHITGNNTGVRTPANVTFCCSLRTGLTTDTPRPPSGRLYHVGPVNPDSGAEEDRWPAAQASAIAAAYDDIRATRLTGGGSTGQWVIVSFWQGGTRTAPVLRASPLVLPVARVYVDRIYATQRRRLPRRQKFTTN